MFLQPSNKLEEKFDTVKIRPVSLYNHLYSLVEALPGLSAVQGVHQDHKRTGLENICH